MKCFLCFAFLVLSTTSSWGSWHLIDSPVTTSLYSISYVDSEAIFVAGSDGVILNFDGDEWHVMDSGTENNLNAISMVTPERGWAVGASGTILQYLDNEWIEFPFDTHRRVFNAVNALDFDDVYFLSYDFLDGTALHHWNGDEMVLMEMFSSNLSGLFVDSSQNIWIAGGNGLVYHYDGVSWDDSYFSFQNIHIFGICLNRNGYPVITAVRLPDWDLDLIYEFIPEIGWTEVWRGYENRLISPAINKTRGFVTGSGGRIVENSIFGWKEVTSPINRQINDVVIPNMSEAFAVCDLGHILHYTEASTEILMNKTMFTAMDPFELHIRVRNPGDTYQDVMKLIMLEAYGVFFFWPGWSDTFDCDFVDLQNGFDETNAIMTFTWPSGAGSGLASFWSALLDTGNNILCYDIETFTWSDSP
jgi:hypothetical protein